LKLMVAVAEEVVVVQAPHSMKMLNTLVQRFSSHCVKVEEVEEVVELAVDFDECCTMVARLVCLPEALVATTVVAAEVEEVVEPKLLN